MEPGALDLRLTIAIPGGQATALRWVIGIVFDEMLGVPVQVAEVDEPCVSISAMGRSIVMRSFFPNLERPRSDWARQIPATPLRAWDPSPFPGLEFEAPLPVLFGEAEVEITPERIRCGIDVFASIFFMLSRFEEVAIAERDRYGRFSALSSLAWKGGFLDRPIVDEYVELLWAMIRRLWPGVERRRRQGVTKVSCDVDAPFDRVGKSAKALVRAMGGDLVKRRDPGLAWRRVRNFVAHRRGDYRFDPKYVFDWYMDVCERYGHCVTFNFIADHSGGAIDGTYEIDEARIIELIRRIAVRGHEIGMHGSFNTYRDAAQLRRERDRLRDSCVRAGVDAPVVSNRQHYLRWDAAVTPDLLEEVGFERDTSGGFSDRPGFRYGTAHPFPLWSWTKNAPLKLREHPLVVMECSVIAERYMNLGHTEKALDLMRMLKRRALRYGGDFSLLWHNSEFLTRKDREFFEALLR